MFCFMRLALIFSLSSKDRLQPFKLQSNYQPSKREMFIFLSLKPMFAEEHFSKPKITCFKAWSRFRNEWFGSGWNSLIGVTGVTYLQVLPKGNWCYKVKFYLKILRLNLISKITENVKKYQCWRKKQGCFLSWGPMSSNY